MARNVGLLAQALHASGVAATRPDFIEMAAPALRHSHQRELASIDVDRVARILRSSGAADEFEQVPLSRLRTGGDVTLIQDFRGIWHTWLAGLRMDRELLGRSLPSWSPVAAVSVLAASIALFRIGYVDLYTESLVIMVLAFGLGALARSLGVTLVATFLAFDLIATWRYDLTWATSRLGRYWDTSLRVLLGRVAATWALALLVVTIPAAARTASVRTLRQSPRRQTFAVLVGGASAAFLVWVWSLMAPYLVRSAFTTNPTVRAISPIQEQGWALAVACGLAAGSAIWLRLSRGQLYPDTALIGIGRRAFAGRQQAVRLALALVLLVGLITSWIDALLLASAWLVAEMLGRTAWAQEWFTRLMHRIPLGVRYAAAFALGWAGARVTMAAIYRPLAGSEFFPFTLSVAITYTAFRLLVGDPLDRKRVAVMTAVLPVLMGLVVLAIPRQALADNCSGLSDCASQAGAAVAAAAAAAGAAVWGWLKGWAAPTPPVVGELEQLLSKEGAEAQYGAFEALKDTDAKNRLGDTGDTEEYHRIRGMTVGEWLEHYYPDWHERWRG